MPHIPTTEFYNYFATAITTLTSYEQGVRGDGNTLFYARKMPAATTLSTLFHGTSLPCPVDKAGLCNKHGKLVQPRNCDFPCQSIQNLDTSSVGSCSKFHEILYQVLPLHPASFPFGGEG